MIVVSIRSVEVVSNTNRPFVSTSEYYKFKSAMNTYFTHYLDEGRMVGYRKVCDVNNEVIVHQAKILKRCRGENEVWSFTLVYKNKDGGYSQATGVSPQDLEPIPDCHQPTSAPKDPPSGSTQN